MPFLQTGAHSDAGFINDAGRSIVWAIALIFLAAEGYPEVSARVVGAIAVQAPPDMLAARPGIAIVVIIIVVCTETAADDQGQDKI